MADNTFVIDRLDEAHANMAEIRTNATNPEKVRVISSEAASRITIAKMKLQESRPDVQKINGELLRMLTQAKQHLEFCGYGDSYESECAKDDNLAVNIETAIRNAKETQCQATE